MKLEHIKNVQTPQKNLSCAEKCKPPLVAFSALYLPYSRVRSSEYTNSSNNFAESTHPDFLATPSMKL